MGLLRYCGHCFHRVLDGVVYLCKFGDAYHVEDFFKMLGDSRHGHGLMVFFDLCHNLNQQCNPATVDVGIPVNF